MKITVKQTEKEDVWNVALTFNEIQSIAAILRLGIPQLKHGWTSDDVRLAAQFAALAGRQVQDGEPNNNPTRSRYYGKRIGDIVEFSYSRKSKKNRGEVVDLGFMDNNRIHVIWDGDKHISDEVAEFLKVITKVEDRT